MGKLYTSRYSNRDLEKNDAIKIGISLGKPRFPLKYELTANIIAFAPSRAIFRMTDKQAFRRRYFEQLDRLGTQSVMEMLRNAGYGLEKDVVLLCYEDITCDDPDKNWCHRTYLAEWIQANLGIEVKEYPDSNTFAKKKGREAKKYIDDDIEGQLALF